MNTVALVRDALRRFLPLVIGGPAIITLVAQPARAASLEDYYRTMMTVHACELIVDEGQWERLTLAIEEKISSTNASSDTVDGIFERVGDEMRDNLEAYCSDNADDATAVLSNLT